MTPPARRRAERGAATAELALVLPLLVSLTVGLIWLLAVGAAQIRAVDAARETARAIARGDSEGDAVARGRRVAPEGSRIAVSTRGGQVVVRVSGRVEGPGGVLGGIPSPRIGAEAVAAMEETQAAW